MIITGPPDNDQTKLIAQKLSSGQVKLAILDGKQVLDSKKPIKPTVIK